jgi:hypothetical protein
MKSILDRSFRYTPSVETDVRKTFARVRRREREKERVQAVADAEAKTKVLLIDQLKKASASTAPSSYPYPRSETWSSVQEMPAPPLQSNRAK